MGFPLGPHWGKLPDHFNSSLYQACSHFSSYIELSRSLRSSSTIISAPLRKTLQDLFHPMHLMSIDEIDTCPCFLCLDAASFQKVFLRVYLGSTIHWPSKSEFIQVSWCRPPNAFQFSWFLHSCLGLARYCSACKCCVTYLHTNILGREKLAFGLQKCIKSLLQPCRIQKKNPRVEPPWTPVFANGTRKLPPLEIVCGYQLLEIQLGTRPESLFIRYNLDRIPSFPPSRWPC